MPTRRFLLIAAATGALLAGAATSLSQSIAESVSNSQSEGEIAMTNPASPSTLKVPGAEIYYEVRGTGPTLLIIPGGPQDAGVFAGLSASLADRYTVVAYDPRGNSRTVVQGELGELSLDQQADDAAALIRAVGSPAYVFGTSGGAQIGLNLAARYPDLVKALVAHEPPTTMLLDDPSAAIAADKDLYDTYRTEGVEAAMGKFFTDNGLDGGAEEGGEAPPEFEMSPEDMETFGRVSSNFEYWLAHGMMPLSLYVPDVATLSSGEPQIVVALGEQSAGQPIYDMGAALANKLGVEPTAFPGDHMGFEQQTEAFAEAVHDALTGH